MDIDQDDESHDRMAETETAESENWVKHVPNLREIKDAVFDWNGRSFIVANFKSQAQDYPENAKGWWCMYKCNEPQAIGLEDARKNQFFREAWDARAFGDVYVFRLEDTAADLLRGGPPKTRSHMRSS